GDGAIDRGGGAGDYDLPRRIDVGDGKDVARGRFVADGLRFLDGRTEERGHAAGSDGNGFLHELAAEVDDLRGLGGSESADADERAVLAEGVTGDQIAPRDSEVFEHG